MFFEIDIDPKERAVGRFIGAVRKALLRAAFSEKEKSGVSQQSIAKKLGVNRSVIHRILKGEANLTLRSVAEIAWALGWEIDFSLRKTALESDKEVAPSVASATNSVTHQARMQFFDDGSVPIVLGAMNVIENDNYAPVEVAA